MKQTKSFPITKRRVGAAGKQVKANKGSGGVDGGTRKGFEAYLGNHLSQLWNRRASGRDFPLPVLRVEIPQPRVDVVCGGFRRGPDREGSDGGQAI